MEQNRVARCWVLRDGGRVVGYVCLWEIGDELHVTNIAVEPERFLRLDQLVFRLAQFLSTQQAAGILVMLPFQSLDL